MSTSSEAFTAPLSEDTRAAVLDAEQDDATKHCLVCYSDLMFTTIMPCDHNEICGVCILRLRHLHSDKRCPICKQENEQVIVDEPDKKTFEEYAIWGNELGSDFVYREDVGMFFPVDYYKREIQPLFGYHCTLPTCDYDGTTPHKNIYQETADNEEKSRPKQTSPIRALQDHLRVKHRLALCQLCVDHHRDFVARLPRFNPSQLKQHLTKGDGPSSGFEGHPICEFCRPKRFYDINTLHQHLNKEHYKCHVCEKQGLSNQFFKNYRSLERHFDNQHFLCHDVQCLSARFVVFENELDLRHHERQVHGGTSTGNSKIQLEFRIRRSNEDGQYLNQEVPSDNDFNYGLDGQAFVPAELPQSEGVQLHPMHVQRTAELRERAAALRQNHSDGAEAFPTLAGEPNEQTDAPQQAFRVGWNSGSTLKMVGRKKDAGKVTEEDFPSLPTAPKPKHMSSVAMLKPTPGAQSNQRKQFAAMQMSAGAGGPSWKNSATSTAGRTAPVPAQSFLASTSAASVPRNSEANLTSENFPSLGGASTTQRHRYTAADAFVKKKQSGPSLSSDNFPSLGGASSSPQSHRYAAAEALSRKQQPRKPEVPTWNDASDFPPPVSSTAKPSVREKLLSSSAGGPSHVAMANVLQGHSIQHNVTVEDMKASLGAANYKQLKKLTKEFAAGELSPDAYVDHSAALFDQGYGDQDFWSFLPSLLASCPNESAANQATNYMENLKRLRNGASNAESVSGSKAGASVSSWTSGPSLSAESPSHPAAPQGQWSSASARVAAAPPATTTISQPAGRYVAPPHQVRSVPGKKKAAWGGAGGVSTVVRAKAPPGSVAIAAAELQPRTGTATKYMAQQSKQEKQQQQNSQSSGKSKKKKSQKNELRQLAFG